MKIRTKLGIGLACVSASAVGFFLATRKKNQDAQMLQTPNKIDEKEFIIIGGMPQFLYHRSEDSNNPVILYLHGGPGQPASGSSYLFQREWEKNFTVVHWDQRLSGMTYMINRNQLDDYAHTVTVQQLIEDIKEIVLHCQNKYNKRKIIILGHSWGSVLGTLFVKKYPQFVLAYVGVGQVINMKENEMLGYQKTVEEAARASNLKDLATLEALLPYPSENFDKWAKRKLMKLRKLQRKYDLASSMGLKGIWKICTSPVYELGDLQFLIRDVMSLQQSIMDYLMKFDLFKESFEYEVPVYYLLGDHDWQTPTVLAQSYFDQIEAPSKQLILIPGAGHSAMMDQPVAFAQALKKALQKYL